jgi:NADH:ubiquinone oxidoreductase subunit 6 (subunit J)
MLNTKVARLKVDNANYAFLGLIFVIVTVFEFLFVLRFETIPLVTPNKQYLSILADLSSLYYLPDFLVWDHVEHNGRFLGQVLFTEYFILFIVCGFILLLAMISAIVLTLNNKFVAKSQNIYAQVLRDSRLSISSKH